jgi:uncharacterized protein YjiS (DUF1127 family)
MSTSFIPLRNGHAPRIAGSVPLSVLFAGIRGAPASIGVWLARSHQRCALRELAERSDRDHLLGDIGVTPADARRASSKWFWQP